jgi:ferric-dicitrate binding protein FerR (iron transport regulator)
MQEKENTPPTVEELIGNESFVSYCLDPMGTNSAFWEEWLKLNPDQQSKVQDAKRIIILLSERPSDKEVATDKARLLRELGLTVPPVKAKKVFAMPLFRWIAAAVVLFFFSTSVFYVYHQRTGIVADRPASAEMVRQEVPAGKMMNLRLRDGTIVNLGPGSRLTYPAVFNGTSRLVELQGDAKFVVSHIKKQPFIIKTTDLQIRVLGTTFNVQSFQTDRYARIALFEGAVQVERKDRTYQVQPGQVFIYDKFTEHISITPFNKREEQERINGLLVFENASYEELGQRLAHKYNLKFISDSTIKIAFSGKFADEPIAKVLEKLNFTTPYHFTIESNTLIVKQK